MADESKYEHKVVWTVRGTRGLVISKMQKDGWEFVDETAEGLRTSLNFRRPRKSIPWARVAATAAGVAVLTAVITVGAMRERDELKPGAVSPSPTPASSSAHGRTPVRASAYDSVRDLMSAAIEGGYPCPNRQVSRPAGLNSRDAGSCTDYDYFGLTYLTVHGEDAMRKAADDHIAEYQDDPFMAGATFVVGPNWVIQCRPEHAAKLRRSLGGVVATVPGKFTR
jgi:hypothetical protein